MSDQVIRPRQSTRSTPAGYQSAQLGPERTTSHKRIGKAQILAATAVVIVAAMLITLIWLVTTWTVQDQEADIRDHAEQSLSGQAALIAETIAHELLLIDQSLTVIQEAWRTDSNAVDLEKWHAKLPALLSVADDLFIADGQHVIRQDILPKAIGQGVGAAYVTFPHGSLEKVQPDGAAVTDTSLSQDRMGPAIDTRQFLMYIVRPLDHPKGWLVGASFRSKELVKIFNEARLGYNAVVCLIDTRRGMLQAIAGPAARRPKTDLSKTKLYSAMERAPSGTWLGESAIDDMERLHAFQRVAGRDMAVLVGANWAEVIAPARGLAAGARALAAVGSVLVVVISGLVLWGVFAIRDKRRRQRHFDRNRRELDHLRAGEGALTATAQINAARLHALLGSTSDGVGVFDQDLRLIQWNDPFARHIGVAPQRDMLLDALLRDRLMSRPADDLSSAEVEVARLMGLLRTGEAAALPRAGAGDGTVCLLGVPVAEGGLMILVNDRADEPGVEQSHAARDGRQAALGSG